MSVMQGYAFVEYSVPNGALKCKEGMDKIEAEMRPDFRRKACSVMCMCCTLSYSCLSIHGSICWQTGLHDSNYVQAQVHIWPQYQAANL